MARCFRCDADVWPKFHSDLVGSCPCTKDRNESNSFNSLLFVQPPSKPILSPHSNFPLDTCKLYCTCFVNLVSSRETTDVTSSTRTLRFRRQRAMQPRLQTIPSCESVHLLGREKHQKGVLSPVGAPHRLTEPYHRSLISPDHIGLYWVMDVVEKYAFLTYLEMFRPVTTLYSNPSSLFQLSLDPSFSNQPPPQKKSVMGNIPSSVLMEARTTSPKTATPATRTPQGAGTGGVPRRLAHGIVS